MPKKVKEPSTLVNTEGIENDPRFTPPTVEGGARNYESPEIREFLNLNSETEPEPAKDTTLDILSYVDKVLKIYQDAIGIDDRLKLASIAYSELVKTGQPAETVAYRSIEYADTLLAKLKETEQTVENQ